MNLYQAHTQWRDRPEEERYRNLDSMHTVVKARDDTSRDQRIRMDREIPAVINGYVEIRDDQGQAHRLTHWASRQLLGRVHAPPEFLGSISPAIASAALSDRIKREGFMESRILTGFNDVPVIRAFHGERYSRLWDSDVTRAILNTGLPAGWRNPVAYEAGKFGAELVPSGLYASDRDVFAFFVDGGDMLDLGPRAQLHRGFFVYNSEVGARSFGWTSFYFNVVCGNHIIWDASDVQAFRARHVGDVQAAFRGFKIFLNTLADTPDHTSLVRAVEAAKREIAASLQQPAEEVLKDAMSAFSKRNFTKAEVLGAVERIGAEEVGAEGTRWDWLQGFTAYARGLSHAGERVELEQRARRALLPAVK